MKLELSAQAKLNLALDILGTDEKGYHLLDMLMQSISLSDTLTLEDIPGQDIELTCPGYPELETSGNIVFKTAGKLRQRLALDNGVRITLIKRIPQQAGMGGGSADAAAALLGLNTLWGLELSSCELAELGLALGADVPFALMGGLARAGGIGEELQALPHSRTLHFACAMPELGLSTPEVYRLYDRMAKGRTPNIERLLSALESGDWESIRQSGGNVLEPPAIRLRPEIAFLKADFYELGAVYTAMTGSGAAVFGLFENEASARGAAKAIRGKAAWSAYAHSTGARQES